MPHVLPVTGTLVCVIGLLASTSDGQISDASSNTRIWLASVVMVNDDTTLRTHGLFRQLIGLGSSKPLAQSWTFSPSFWLVATETRDWTSAQPEAHATLTWRHRIEETWSVASGGTLEVSAASLRDSDFKLRVTIERKMHSTRLRTALFATWEDVCRFEGGSDHGRAQVGIRTQLRDGLQIIAAYSRARGIDGNGPMSGGLVAAFYDIDVRSHRSRN